MCEIVDYRLYFLSDACETVAFVQAKASAFMGDYNGGLQTFVVVCIGHRMPLAQYVKQNRFICRFNAALRMYRSADKRFDSFISTQWPSLTQTSAAFEKI